MTMPVNKLGIFSQAQPIKAAAATKAVGGQLSGGSSGGQASGNNPFSGSTVGINTNIGIGESMNIAAQAGKKPGIGRTLGFA